jgi:sirohydrochlorin cobaltochelatase
MSRKLAKGLLAWLEAGRELIGEVQIERSVEGFELRHYLDRGATELTVYGRAEEAIELGKYDAAGKYRPLRTAPTLQRGWLLRLMTAEETLRALDFFYPAMLGTALAFEENRGLPVHLRDTVNRQTGMYRITGKITNEQADGLIGEACAAGRCLKTITWKIEPDYPVSTLSAGKTDLSFDLLERGRGFIPLPCEECCNMLVASARETVKKALSTTPPPV